MLARIMILVVFLGLVLFGHISFAAGQAVGEGAPIEVKVGVYDFIPYADLSNGTGGIFQVIKFMNMVQNRYDFKAVPTTARGRYTDLSKRKFDIMLFEDPDWGWRKRKVRLSRPITRDVSVYVGLRDKVRNQAFFEDFEKKHMLLVAGYHYGFAGLSAGRNAIQKRFKATFYLDQTAMLEALLAGKGDVAVAAKSFLEYYADKDPTVRYKLATSNKADQVYDLHGILRPKAPISVKDLDDIIAHLKMTGQWPNWLQ